MRSTRPLVLMMLAIAGCSATANEHDDTGSSDDGGTTTRAIPCDVQEVIDRQCTTCHGELPRYGAPMPLWTASDWKVPAPSDPTVAIHEQAAVRIDDEARPMPPTMAMPA